MERNPVIESVDRALVLIQALATSGRVSVSEVAETLSVSPSTAHRMLQTFVARGFAVQGSDRQYRSGPELDRAVHGGTNFRLLGLARRHVEALVRATGETVLIAVPLGTDIRVVDGMEADQRLRVTLRVGARVPAYCTASGKAMLALMDWEDVLALHPAGLQAFPSASVRDLDGLRRELQRVRRRGYAMNVTETVPDVVVIGAGIRGSDGRPVAGLSVCLPMIRFNADSEKRCGLAVAAACTELEQDLRTS